MERLKVKKKGGREGEQEIEFQIKSYTCNWISFYPRDEEMKKNGKEVFCLLGKVVVDTEW